MIITWWQFSDLHWIAKPESERLQFVKELLRHLQDEVAPTYGTPAFVAMTGDVAYSGSKDEYASASDHLFHPLSLIVGNDAPLLFVPGNHDQERSVADLVNPKTLQSLTSPAAVDSLFVDENATAAFATPFKNYVDFVQSVGSPCANPFMWNHHINIGDSVLSISGVNSAWSAYFPAMVDGSSDERRLVIGAAQILTPTSEANYSFALMHHPFDWLNRELCSRAEHSVRDNFDFVLNGHVHSPSDLQLRTTASGTCFEVPSPLLYKDPYEDSIAYSRGFVVGELDLELGVSRVRYFRYSDFAGPKFSPFSELYKTGQQYLEARIREIDTADSVQSASASPNLLGCETLLPTERAIGKLTAALPSLNEIDSVQSAQLKLFERLVDGQPAPSNLSSEMTEQTSALAYIAASLGVLKASDRRSTTSGGVFDERVIAELVTASSDIDGITDLDEFAALLRHVEVGSLDAFQLALLRADSTAQMFFALYWAIAQYILLLDVPDAGANESAGLMRSNILDVVLSSPGETPILRLRTSSKSGFHQIAENRHIAETCVSEAEDLWRRVGLIAPSIRVRTELPNWRRSRLESFQLRVDPKPIARLLMGKALYGSRKHVWLRELVQNALDATETRRLVDSLDDYEPLVAIDYVDSSTVVIRDNGVGMTHQEINDYLATLGRSGWRSVEREGPKDAAAFFGRFGIGFAAVFNVAESVVVFTRRSGARSIDGFKVTFSSPERPYFIEPASCEEGTKITINLREPFSLDELDKALIELFAYRPAALKINAANHLPDSLVTASNAVGKVPEYGRTPKVSSVVATRLAAYDVSIRTEIIAPIPSKKEQHRYGIPGQTALTISVDGMRVFDQDDLVIDESGKPPKGRGPGYYIRQRLGFTNCFATIDFVRENAPVLPSRDAIETSEALISEARRFIQNEVVKLLPDLVNELSRNTNDDLIYRRSVFMDALRSVIGPPFAYRWDGQLYRPDDITSQIGSHYRSLCPVITRSKGATILKLLDEVSPSGSTLAVTARVSESGAFVAYAQSAGIEEWLVAEDPDELAILESAWPYDEDLDTYASVVQLYRHNRHILPEARDLKLLKALRGDYAFSSSDAFGSAFFLRIPNELKPIARHVGKQKRRINVNSAQPPRGFLNASHPSILALERYLLDNENDAQVLDQVSSWLDNLCDGVIEDESKMAPENTWGSLVERLLRWTKVDLRNTTVDDLREYF